MHVNFQQADSPRAILALRDAMNRMPAGSPILGLIVKVNQENQVVNLEVTDTETIRSLAFVGELEKTKEEHTEP